MGDLDGAIDLYHQALSCKPDDPFSSEMLNKALQEALSSPFQPTQVTSRRVLVPLGQTSATTTSSKMSKSQDWPKHGGIDGRAAGRKSMVNDDVVNLSNESTDMDMSMA